jgi:hypothetical protein
MAQGGTGPPGFEAHAREASDMKLLLAMLLMEADHLNT